MAERPLHIAVLETLARRIGERREQLKEQMANGLPHEDYLVAIGRAREAKVLLERIEEMVKAAREGEFEDEYDADIESASDRRRASRARKPRR